MNSAPEFSVATCLLFDRNKKLLIYLRDNKAEISFPNHWDLFGGIIEPNETPEQALVREVKEELGIELKSFKKFREYEWFTIEKPNRQYVFYSQINFLPEELTLHEGQKLTSISLSERKSFRFANILGTIIDEFAGAEIKF